MFGRRRRGSELSSAQEAVVAHVRRFFAGHRKHVFVSIGCWDAVHEDGHGLEFVLVAPDDAPRHALQVAMTAHYHADPHDETSRLDVGHTVPIGEPWSPGSRCDHFLVSLPYPFGPELEVCTWDGGHARLVWLLPITAAERDFKVANGLEALEQRFDAAGLAYWEPGRDSEA